MCTGVQKRASSGVCIYNFKVFSFKKSWGWKGLGRKKYRLKSKYRARIEFCYTTNI